MKILINSDKTRLLITKVGEKLNSPHQRLILGATALATQPFIDFHNKKADKETRAVSVARTIGKIVAGTLTGVAIRALSIYTIGKFSGVRLETVNGITKIVKNSKKDIFVPLFAKIKAGVTEETFKKEYGNYTKALGTYIATAAMVFTNFLFDVPLTKFFTEKLTPKVKSVIDKENRGKT